MAREPKDDVKELLLEDYKYFQDSFWKNEETGETRVRFYITLVTAVLAAVATLLASDADAFSDAQVLYITSTSLFALLLFGFITLLRIIKRNEVTDGYKKSMDEIRNRFKEFYDKEGILEGYSPFGKSVKVPKVRKLGGLSHTVAAINSVIAAILIGMPLVSSSLVTALIVTPATILVFMLIQYFYIRHEGRCHKAMLYRPKYTHAGGIVVRKDSSNNEYLYLIVTAKTRDNSEQWVFPKGHIERCEWPKDTAIREVREESGVRGEIIELVGISDFMRNEEEIRSAMYLMRLVKVGKPAGGEKREIHWLPYDKARAMLSFDDARFMLDAVQQYINTTTDLID